MSDLTLALSQFPPAVTSCLTEEPEPQRMDDPLRERLKGESLVEFNRALLAHSLWELSLFAEDWEDAFAQVHPGPGYINTLQAQVDRLRRELGLPAEVK
jgi:hypothetical protein